MPLDQLLIDVLVCPVDKGPLLWFDDEQLLYNPRLKKGYEVRDDIPVLLVDESRDVDTTEHDRLMVKAKEAGVPETGVSGRRRTEES
ncbi:MAG: Trm112 family protein [Acidimicrobiales bacterium]